MKVYESYTDRVVPKERGSENRINNIKGLKVAHVRVESLERSH